MLLALASAVNADMQILHSFGDPAVLPADGKETDGTPLLIGSTLFGVTEEGGVNAAGACLSYDLKTDAYQILYHFSDDATAGQAPICTLISVGSTLYGTTSFGGALADNDGGTIFRIDTSGANYLDLHSFGSPVDAANGWKSFKA